jgi:hypothetical protein
MSFSADAVTWTLLAVVAALVAGILAFAVRSRLRARRRQRDIIVIRATIIDYFRRSGVEVAADCTGFRENGRFIAIIESEPMKRFRLSHIIEMTVREHVYKACGLELEKIYWRFPIKEATQTSAGVAGAVSAASDAAAAANEAADGADIQSKELSDDYINEGLEHYRHIPKPEVEELPWESFEQVTTGGRQSDPGGKS